MTPRRWPNLTPHHIATLFLCLLTLWLLFPLYPAFLAAPVFTAIASPLYDRLKRHLGTAAALTISITTLLLLTTIPLVWLSLSLYTQATDLLVTLSHTDLSRYSNLKVFNFQLGTQIEANSSVMASWLAFHALSWTKSLVEGLGQFILALLLTAFLLPSRHKVWETLVRYLPIDPQLANTFRTTFTDLSRITLLGYFITCTIQGLAIGLALHFLHFENAIFWGTVAGLCGLIPVIGSTIVWLPAVLWLLASHRTTEAIILAVLCVVVVGNIDTIFRPALYRRMAKVHPLVTLIGVIAGVPFFGPLGLILGPLLIASTFLALAHLDTIIHTSTFPTQVPPPTQSQESPLIEVEHPSNPTLM